MPVSKEEFMQQAQKVKGAYDDFVVVSWYSAKQSNDIDEIYQYMLEHPDATTDEVTAYSWDLEGIKY